MLRIIMFYQGQVSLLHRLLAQKGLIPPQRACCDRGLKPGKSCFLKCTRTVTIHNSSRVFLSALASNQRALTPAVRR